MTAGTKVLIKLTSDEVNCLIYSYLKDSGAATIILYNYDPVTYAQQSSAIFVPNTLGFDHTAYNLRHEAHLDHSPNINVSLPRGELISLLRKAMLFQESEEAFHNKVRLLSRAARADYFDV